MRQTFSLFNTPIDLAHFFWRTLLEKSSTQRKYVIDATCGNGKDALFLALLLEKEKGSTLVCLDIQEVAIQNTKALLEKEAPLCSVNFFLGSHETLPAKEKEALLIVYNLGYLPKGNKSLTTTVSSTLYSIKQALACLSDGGLLSITCYPGHLEGKKEEEELLSFLSSLPPDQFCFTSFFFENRRASPSLFLVQKTK